MIQEIEKIIWTEREVKYRLEDFSLDDSLYDIQAVRMSFMKIGRSSSEDSMPGKAYRLLKRDELIRAMSYLLSPGKKELKGADRNEYAFLYYLIQDRYICTPAKRISQLVFLTGQPWATLKDKENRAIGLITGFLNSFTIMD